MLEDLWVYIGSKQLEIEWKSDAITSKKGNLLLIFQNIPYYF